MTVAFIDAHRDRFAVAAMCRVLEFAERTFYAAKVRSVCARAWGHRPQDSDLGGVEGELLVLWGASAASICDVTATRSPVAPLLV